MGRVWRCESWTEDVEGWRCEYSISRRTVRAVRNAVNEYSELLHAEANAFAFGPTEAGAIIDGLRHGAPQVALGSEVIFTRPCIFSIENH